SSWDKNICVWLGDKQDGRALAGHTDIVAGCDILPNGKQVLSWSHDNTLRLWDLTTWKAQTTFTGHADRVLAAGISPDGKWAASGSRDHVLKIWELETG